MKQEAKKKNKFGSSFLRSSFGSIHAPSSPPPPINEEDQIIPPSHPPSDVVEGLLARKGKISWGSQKLYAFDCKLFILTCHKGKDKSSKVEEELFITKDTIIKKDKTTFEIQCIMNNSKVTWKLAAQTTEEATMWVNLLESNPIVNENVIIPPPPVHDPPVSVSTTTSTSTDTPSQPIQVSKVLGSAANILGGGIPPPPSIPSYDEIPITEEKEPFVNPFESGSGMS